MVKNSIAAETCRAVSCCALKPKGVLRRHGAFPPKPWSFGLAETNIGRGSVAQAELAAG